MTHAWTPWRAFVGQAKVRQWIIQYSDDHRLTVRFRFVGAAAPVLAQADLASASIHLECTVLPRYCRLDATALDQTQELLVCTDTRFPFVELTGTVEVC